MKNGNPYCLLILLAFTMLPSYIAHSCGYQQARFYGYSFINKDILPNKVPYAPFVLRFDKLYSEIAHDAETTQVSDNVTEWQERTCPDTPKADISTLIYKIPLQQIKLLKTAASSEGIALPARLSANRFAQFLVSKKCLETIDYLIFAKECEPHVIASDAWESPKRDAIAMEKLIKKGQKQFKKTKSHYIRLRYAFQLIRLAHYKKSYQEVLDLHDFLMPKIDAHPSILDYWIMGHQAGAFRSMGRHVEASYLYALIFQHCPSKREQAFQSFLIKTDEEWQQCLLLCEHDSERAMLYTLRANSDESRSVEEMEKIYLLNPENENLPLLLVKEIRKLEKDYLGLAFNLNKRENKRYYKIPRKDSEHYLIRLQQLVQKIIQENEIPNKELWLVTDAYLKFLAGDNYAANKTFARIHPLITNTALQEQVEVFQLALQINSYDEIDNEDESEISELIRKNEWYSNKKYKDFPNFLFDKLAYDYEQNGQIGKAFRTKHPIADMQYHLDLDLIDDLLTLCNREDRSKLEDALVTDKLGKNIKNQLLDMKGTLYLAEFQLEAALETFKEIPRGERDTTELHPYRDELLDCVNCTQTDTLAFDKVELVAKMIDLNYQARADLQLGAKAFYELGLLYYNLSYYGNCWKGMDYYRSGTNWKYASPKNVHALPFGPNGNQENKDLSQALFYFEKSRLLTKNKELAARAAFMAAKSEHHTWMNEKGNNYSVYSHKMPNFPAEHQTYFHLLKTEYQDTEFYGEAIKECKYFRWYALK